MMNAEVKAKWIAALRSGEYRQGRSKLHIEHPNSFCCLGVLCELAIKENVIPAGKINYTGDGVTAYGKNEHTATLPAEVGTWAGIDSHGTYYDPAIDRERHLTGVNDNGTSFADIASIIERNM